MDAPSDGRAQRWTRPAMGAPSDGRVPRWNGVERHRYERPKAGFDMLVDRVAAIRAAREAGDYRLAGDLVHSAIDTLERAGDEPGPDLAVLLNELGMIG